MLVRAASSPRRRDAVAVAVPSDRIGASIEGHGEAPWDFLRSQGFTGDLGQVCARPGDGGRPAVLYVGAGPTDEAGASTLRSLAAVATRAASRHAALALELGAAAPAVDAADRLRAQAEGAVLGAYTFTQHRSSPPVTSLGEVLVIERGVKGAAAARAVGTGARLGSATCVARDLVNEPGGVLTAPEFADRARALATAGGAACKVHDERAIARMGLGGLLAVNKGSAVPPRFVELVWDPPGARASTPTVALVGKGITFDSGGLSIKTAEGMTTMKSDMAGGAAVLAAVAACRDLGVGVHVRGYIPLTDNMTGGDALRVGDVIAHHGGSTTEVLNTDAEGRLLLADALAWATTPRRGRPAPDAVIDVATLTGACMVALGTRTGGLFATDDRLAEQLLAAAAGAGEPLWRLPLVDAERKALESKVADRKNVGGGRYGGAILAGLFLRDFVAGGVPWAHLDVAGPAFNTGPDELEVPSGGTGFGVRTLLALLTGWERRTDRR